MTRSHVLKIRITHLGLSQERVAEEAGFEPTRFSRYLNGRRTPPADFARRVTAALDRLEEAERAADTARQKVLTRAPKELGGAP